jgi:hypothetical protein
MEVLMGSDVMLDTSIFAWSLHRAEAQSGKKEEKIIPGPVSLDRSEFSVKIMKNGLKPPKFPAARPIFAYGVVSEKGSSTHPQVM